MSQRPDLSCSLNYSDWESQNEQDSRVQYGNSPAIFHTLLDATSTDISASNGEQFGQGTGTYEENPQGFQSHSTNNRTNYESDLSDSQIPICRTPLTSRRVAQQNRVPSPQNYEVSMSYSSGSSSICSDTSLELVLLRTGRIASKRCARRYREKVKKSKAFHQGGRVGGIVPRCLTNRTENITTCVEVESFDGSEGSCTPDTTAFESSSVGSYCSHVRPGACRHEEITGTSLKEYPSHPSCCSDASTVLSPRISITSLDSNHVSCHCCANRNGDNAVYYTKRGKVPGSVTYKLKNTYDAFPSKYVQRDITPLKNRGSAFIRGKKARRCPTSFLPKNNRNTNLLTQGSSARPNISVNYRKNFNSEIFVDDISERKLGSHFKTRFINKQPLNKAERTPSHLCRHRYCNGFRRKYAWNRKKIIKFLRPIKYHRSKISKLSSRSPIYSVTEISFPSLPSKGTSVLAISKYNLSKCNFSSALPELIEVIRSFLPTKPTRNPSVTSGRPITHSRSDPTFSRPSHKSVQPKTCIFLKENPQKLSPGVVPSLSPRRISSCTTISISSSVVCSSSFSSSSYTSGSDFDSHCHCKCVSESTKQNAVAVEISDQCPFVKTSLTPTESTKQVTVNAYPPQNLIGLSSHNPECSYYASPRTNSPQNPGLTSNEEPPTTIAPSLQYNTAAEEIKITAKKHLSQHPTAAYGPQLSFNSQTQEPYPQDKTSLYSHFPKTVPQVESFSHASSSCQYPTNSHDQQSSSTYGTWQQSPSSPPSVTSSQKSKKMEADPLYQYSTCASYQKSPMCYPQLSSYTPETGAPPEVQTTGTSLCQYLTNPSVQRPFTTYHSSTDPQQELLTGITSSFHTITYGQHQPSYFPETVPYQQKIKEVSPGTQYPTNAHGQNPPSPDTSRKKPTSCAYKEEQIVKSTCTPETASQTQYPTSGTRQTPPSFFALYQQAQLSAYQQAQGPVPETGSQPGQHTGGGLSSQYTTRGTRQTPPSFYASYQQARPSAYQQAQGPVHGIGFQLGQQTGGGPSSQYPTSGIRQTSSSSHAPYQQAQPAYQQAQGPIHGTGSQAGQLTGGGLSSQYPTSGTRHTPPSSYAPFQQAQPSTYQQAQVPMHGTGSQSGQQTGGGLSSQYTTSGTRQKPPSSYAPYQEAQPAYQQAQGPIQGTGSQPGQQTSGRPSFQYPTSGTRQKPSSSYASHQQAQPSAYQQAQAPAPGTGSQLAQERGGSTSSQYSPTAFGKPPPSYHTSSPQSSSAYAKEQAVGYTYPPGTGSRQYHKTGLSNLPKYPATRTSQVPTSETLFSQKEQTGSRPSYQYPNTAPARPSPSYASDQQQPPFGYQHTQAPVSGTVPLIDQKKGNNAASQYSPSRIGRPTPSSASGQWPPPPYQQDQAPVPKKISFIHQKTGGSPSPQYPNIAPGKLQYPLSPSGQHSPSHQQDQALASETVPPKDQQTKDTPSSSDPNNAPGEARPPPSASGQEPPPHQPDQTSAPRTGPPQDQQKIGKSHSSQYPKASSQSPNIISGLPPSPSPASDQQEQVPPSVRPDPSPPSVPPVQQSPPSAHQQGQAPLPGAVPPSGQKTGDGPSFQYPNSVPDGPRPPPTVSGQEQPPTYQQGQADVTGPPASSLPSIPSVQQPPPPYQYGQPSVYGTVPPQGQQTTPSPPSVSPVQQSPPSAHQQGQAPLPGAVPPSGQKTGDDPSFQYPNNAPYGPQSPSTVPGQEQPPTYQQGQADVRGPPASSLPSVPSVREPPPPYQHGQPSVTGSAPQGQKTRIRPTSQSPNNAPDVPQHPSSATFQQLPPPYQQVQAPVSGTVPSQDQKTGVRPTSQSPKKTPRGSQTLFSASGHQKPPSGYHQAQAPVSGRLSHPSTDQQKPPSGYQQDPASVTGVVPPQDQKTGVGPLSQYPKNLDGEPRPQPTVSVQQQPPPYQNGQAPVLGPPASQPSSVLSGQKPLSRYQQGQPFLPGTAPSQGQKVTGVSSTSRSPNIAPGGPQHPSSASVKQSVPPNQQSRPTVSGTVPSQDQKTKVHPMSQSSKKTPRGSQTQQPLPRYQQGQPPLPGNAPSQGQKTEISSTSQGLNNASDALQPSPTASDPQPLPISYQNSQAPVPTKDQQAERHPSSLSPNNALDVPQSTTGQKSPPLDQLSQAPVSGTILQQGQKTGGGSSSQYSNKAPGTLPPPSSTQSKPSTGYQRAQPPASGKQGPSPPSALQKPSTGYQQAPPPALGKQSPSPSPTGQQKPPPYQQAQAPVSGTAPPQGQKTGGPSSQYSKNKPDPPPSSSSASAQQKPTGYQQAAPPALGKQSPSPSPTGQQKPPPYQQVQAPVSGTAPPQGQKSGGPSSQYSKNTLGPPPPSAYQQGQAPGSGTVPSQGQKTGGGSSSRYPNNAPDRPPPLSSASDRQHPPSRYDQAQALAPISEPDKEGSLKDRKWLAPESKTFEGVSNAKPFTSFYTSSPRSSLQNDENFATEGDVNQSDLKDKTSPENMEGEIPPGPNTRVLPDSSKIDRAFGLSNDYDNRNIQPISVFKKAQKDYEDRSGENLLLSPVDSHQVQQTNGEPTNFDKTVSNVSNRLPQATFSSKLQPPFLYTPDNQLAATKPLAEPVSQSKSKASKGSNKNDLEEPDVFEFVVPNHSIRGPKSRSGVVPPQSKKTGDGGSPSQYPNNEPGPPPYPSSESGQQKPPSRQQVRTPVSVPPQSQKTGGGPSSHPINAPGPPLPPGSSPSGRLKPPTDYQQVQPPVWGRHRYPAETKVSPLSHIQTSNEPPKKSNVTYPPRSNTAVKKSTTSPGERKVEPSSVSFGKQPRLFPEVLAERSDSEKKLDAMTPKTNKPQKKASLKGKLSQELKTPSRPGEAFTGGPVLPVKGKVYKLTPRAPNFYPMPPIFPFGPIPPVYDPKANSKKSAAVSASGLKASPQAAKRRT